ncbi:MAG: 1-deoxy-D-xylulose-5-phosphate reductoisomerase [Armatimonadetes bacterium]|nr:1-deoxy-D-xylulose-5-phosphate reductoisomerase [Armatimonadota bacterium]
MKKIVVLGSTGSVGKQTLDVIKRHKDRFKVVGLSAGSSWEELARQAEAFGPQKVAVRNPEAAAKLRERLASTAIEVLEGQDGIIDLACMADADMALIALVGISGLLPTLRAMEHGKDIALVNKETLVVGGQLVTATAKRFGVKMLPVDSEHSAIFQCLEGEDVGKVARLILTSSGGPFRTWETEKIAAATVKDALNHPTWNMGSKITIDSATLMNKGFEVIEAAHLFGVPLERIDVVIHPQSVIHSMVEYVDGSVMAQLGTPDMRLPIQHALAYPERLGPAWNRLDFRNVPTLTFEEPRRSVFPCLDFGYQAGKTGGTMPCALNAANEIAVELFLKEKIGFGAIARIIEKTMEQHDFIATPTLQDLLETDRWCRAYARELTEYVPAATHVN